jgi:hypothetical protein
LIFPLDATDPLDTQPNCRGGVETASDEDGAVFDSCLPGQDEPLDCRLCRVLVTAEGKSEEEVEASCEPAPGR